MSSERPFRLEGALCSPTVGSVNVREVPGYRLELTPFGGIKDSGLGYKEGVQEAMKSFSNAKTCSLARI
jgi:acyl-CoA reductase-like NAD-dependent aldehyde dehydrogenase